MRDSKVFIDKFPQANKIILQIKVKEKHCKVVRRAKGAFENEWESFSGARRTHRGARHTGRDPTVVKLHERSALGLLRGTHPQRPKILPNLQQITLKPFKLTSRVYILLAHQSLWI